MSLLTILRPATEKDCQAIHNAHLHAVQYACIRSYDETIMHTWESLLDINSYLETISDKNKALWVVEYKGLIQGFFQVDFKEAQLDALYALPQSRLGHSPAQPLRRNGTKCRPQLSQTVCLSQFRTFLSPQPL